MVRHAEHPFDDSGNALGGPYITQKPECFGPLGQHRHEFRPLLWRKTWLGARSRTAAQARGATLAPALEPLTDGTLGDAERRRNLRLLPAVLVQRPGAAAAARTPIGRFW